MRTVFWIISVILTHQAGCSVFAATEDADASVNVFESAPLNRARRDTPSIKIIQDDKQYYQISVTTTLREHAFYASEFDRMLDTRSAVNVTQLRINDTWHEYLTVQLKFLFYFYGHPVGRIAITGNGHIYVMESGHAAAGSHQQYIAPLMAQFGYVHNASTLVYAVTNDSFWVRWTHLELTGSADAFSFQCAIFKNSSMIFHYHNLPKLAEDAPGIVAGLADVYNYETEVSGQLVREVFVHRAENISIASVVNNSVAFITALPSCGQLRSCGQCMNSELAPTFKCSWCFQHGQCGTEQERQLQAWTAKPCHYPTGSGCNLGPSILDDVGKAARGILGFFLAVLLASLVAFVVAICVYGHRNPDSNVGRCLLSTRQQLRDKLRGGPRLPSALYRPSSGQVRLEEDT